MKPNRERRAEVHLRFIGAFGQREMELTAMRICDEGLLNRLFTKEDVITDDLSAVGFNELCAHKWLQRGPADYWQSSPEFTIRCLAALKKDEKEQHNAI